MEIVKLVGFGAVFRTFGLALAGEKLVGALRSEDETARQLAATMIVRAGAKARPVLREAAATEQSLPVILSMIGDLGDESDEDLLKRFASHPDAQVQLAAKDALQVLHAHSFVQP